MTAKGLALLLVAAILLSGCASKKGGDDGGSDTTGTTTGSGTKTATGTKTGTTSGTGTGGPVGNGTGSAPTATLSANLTEGSAPLNVTLSVNATDADGDALSWSLDFGDGSAPANGTSANGTVATTLVHAFAAGNHTAVLNVTSGGATATANVTITVLAGAGGVLIDETLHVIFGCELCTDGEGEAIPCIGLGAGRNEGDCAWVVLPADAAGRTFTVTGTSPSPVPVDDFNDANPDIAVLSACDIEASVLLFQAGDTDGDETGVIPAGAGCLVAWDYDETWIDIEFHFLVA
jgi:PKD repeat protein